MSSKYGVLQDGTIAYVTAAPSAANKVGQTISIDASGYYYYDSTPNKWMKFTCGCSGEATVTDLSCSTATITGTLIAGLPSSGVSVSVPYTGGNGGSYSAQSVSSTVITGLTATLPAGTLSTSTGNIVYSISGTPSASGTASFPISLGGKSCTLSIPVRAALATGSGSLAGKTCFDVVEVNDGGDCGTKVRRLSQKSDFSLAATNTQTYIFTPTSAVSNVRFYYANTNGNVITAISGGNAGTNITGAVNATVNYNTALNTLAATKTRDQALTANIIVVYNNSANNTGTDVQLTLKVNVQDCQCCGAFIAPGVFKNFMCQNLGSTMTADPFTPSAAIHGAKYQWGYKPSNPLVSDSRYITQANDQIYNGTIPGWIPTAAPNDSWSDTVKTVNDPCPAGYRVPTNEQWNGVVANNTKTYIGSWNASPSNYSSGINIGKYLFLPAGSRRSGGTTGGNLVDRGQYGFYWASTQGSSSTSAYRLFFTLNLLVGNTPYNRDEGFSVRCVSE